MDSNEYAGSQYWESTGTMLTGRLQVRSHRYMHGDFGVCWGLSASLPCCWAAPT